MYFWFIEGEGLEIQTANVQCSNIIFATCITIWKTDAKQMKENAETQASTYNPAHFISHLYIVHSSYTSYVVRKDCHTWRALANNDVFKETHKCEAIK